MSTTELRAAEVGHTVTDCEGDTWVKVDDDAWNWSLTGISSADLVRNYGPVR